MVCAAGACDAYGREVEATSQRGALKRSRNILDAMLLLGGNGAGKSEAAAQIATVATLGRNHPDAAEWIRANGVDPDLFAPEGGLVIVSSLTHDLSRQTLRPKIERFAGPGAVWRNQDGNSEAECWPDPTRRGKNDGAGGEEARILFKANKQGRRNFQGYGAVLIILDEEHAEDVFSECLSRLDRCAWECLDGSRRSGWILLPMTPLMGMSWVWRQFVNPDTREPSYRHSYIWGENNPYLDQAARSRKMARKGLSDAERAARDRGIFGAATGRIYTEWDELVHLVRREDLPDLKHASWIESIDFGDTNPFCYMLEAYFPKQGKGYLVHVHYKAETLLSDHAAEIKRVRGVWIPEASRHRIYTVSDPAQAGQRRSLALEYGIPSMKAKKDVRAGIAECRVALSHGPARPPTFYVLDEPQTMPFRREIAAYRWKDRSGDKSAPEEPVKTDDHAMDAWRYAIMARKFQIAF